MQIKRREEVVGVLIKDLLKGVEVVRVQGEKGVKVSHLALDSRRVVPGSVFFAIKGEHADGNEYIGEAMHRGAVAIVSEKGMKGVNGVCCVQVEDVREAMGKMARGFYGKPDEGLRLIGVTGTNGKSTVTQLIKHLLEGAGERCGLIGTVKYDVGGRTLPAGRTTPESLESYGLFREMRRNGVTSVAMEVSSHALDMKRVQDMNFEVGVFLNLTQDHLDFHETMKNYYESKRKLFTGEVARELKGAVVNVDDEYGRRLAGELRERGMKVVTFSLEGRGDINGEDIQLTFEGSEFKVMTAEGEYKARTRILGRFNVSNCLAAIAVGRMMGKGMEELLDALPGFNGVPGRMQRVEEGQGFSVVVDYACTDDALRNCLTMLKEITKGRILVVFGCGGNRDRTKRPKMMGVVQEFADYVYATADNPRRESLDVIFEDMKKGVVRGERVEFIRERRRAIDKAIGEAKEGDCVLIAGKGHETYQEIEGTIFPFNDYEVARELLLLKKAGGGSIKGS